jgi:hypothetical protein
MRDPQQRERQPAGSLAPMSRFGAEMTPAPVGSQPGDLLKRAALIEQVCRSRHDFEFHRGTHPPHRVSVHLIHRFVIPTDNQQRRRLDVRECPIRQIGPPTARDDGSDRVRTCRRGISAAAAPVLASDSARGRSRRSGRVRIQSMAPTTRSPSMSILNRYSRVRWSTDSSSGISKSSRSVANAADSRAPATARFQRLKRSLPLPCANTTSPLGPSGTCRAASTATTQIEQQVNRTLGLPQQATHRIPSLERGICISPATKHAESGINVTRTLDYSARRKTERREKRWALCTLARCFLGSYVRPFLAPRSAVQVSRRLLQLWLHRQLSESRVRHPAGCNRRRYRPHASAIAHQAWSM